MDEKCIAGPYAELGIAGTGRGKRDLPPASDQIADPESDVEVGLSHTEALQRNPYDMTVRNTWRIAYHDRKIPGD